MINFTPLTVVTFFRDVLQAYFRQANPEMRWSNDKDSKLWIGTVNDYHQSVAYQKLPRILVTRGGVSAGIRFINDSLEVKQNGKHYSTMPINGSLMVIVEASDEGTTEILGEVVRRLIVRAKPMIESEFGFQAFAREWSMSECQPDREDKEKFKITIQIPYIVEDRWYQEQEEVLLKGVLLELKPN